MHVTATNHLCNISGIPDCALYQCVTNRLHFLKLELVYLIDY